MASELEMVPLELHLEYVCFLVATASDLQSALL